MDTACLKGTSLFASLKEPDLKLLLQKAHEIPFEKDDPIIRQGQTHSSLYVVVDGVLHVSRNTGTSTTFLGRLERGSFFGEVGLFVSGPATATVRSMSKGLLYEFRREEFDEFLEQHTALGYVILKAMMQEMARRLRAVDQRFSASVFWGALSETKK